MVNIHWFRRDLRIEDNASLYHALKSEQPVVGVFIFDTIILDELNEMDARVQFIFEQVKELKDQFNKYGGDLRVYYDSPLEAWKKILDEFDVKNVFTNEDYEPYAKERDQQIAALCKTKNVGFKTFKDQVIFDYTEVLKDNGDPYVVYTPYARKWLAKLNTFYLSSYPSEKYLGSGVFQTTPQPYLQLSELGFAPSAIAIPPKEVSRSRIRNYESTRDIPSLLGTSRLGIHYRFGTISIREKVKAAQDLSEKYLKELIWRDFYSQILAHFPRVVVESFRPEYDNINWLNNENQFEKWKAGQTGYPIVDAGMRELLATGFMHNRVRMITASFLTKHLLIDWRWGEAWFAQNLLDYDLASNNGGWQWAAGCGVDAAPYFRVFNPYLQAEKFDPERKYIKKWVPEVDTNNYPKPIVDHATARKRCLEVYKSALK